MRWRGHNICWWSWVMFHASHFGEPIFHSSKSDLFIKIFQRHKKGEDRELEMREDSKKNKGKRKKWVSARVLGQPSKRNIFQSRMGYTQYLHTHEIQKMGQIYLNDNTGWCTSHHMCTKSLANFILCYFFVFRDSRLFYIPSHSKLGQKS